MAKIIEQFAVEFEQEEIDRLGINPNDVFDAFVENGKIVLRPFEKIEIDLDEFPLEVLHFLIKESCEKNISVNEVIDNILRENLS